MAFLLKSRQQIISDMIAMFLANTALSDFNKGSVISTFIEAAATEDFNQYYQMLQIISNFALANVSGPDLDNRAVEYGLDGRIQPQQATSTVNIIDTAFTKVSTNIYAGFPGPVTGQTTLFANGDTGFPASGSIIVGRGTTNAETIPYSSITTGTNFVIFNLTAGLQNDHGTNESIILSQGGNRTIQQGSIVDVPASDFNTEIDFSIDFTTVLLDGENEIDGVAITAVLAGSSSNVPAGSIDTFNNLPFATATVTNPLSVNNGRDLETDDQLRDRIVATIQSLSRGTITAIETGVQGVIDPVTNKRVVSSSFIDVVSETDVAKLIIDDGTGFEASYTGQGYEDVLNSAQGGETFLQIDNFPMVKALVTTINSQPYAILDGMTLVYEVNDIEETFSFENSDFGIPGSATAQEVVTAINARSTLIQARTAGGSTLVQITAIAETNETIQVIGGTANATNILNFPLAAVETLNLYKFDGSTLTALSKDGDTAELISGNVAPFDFGALVPGIYLDIREDGESLLNDTAGSGSGLSTIQESSSHELSSRFINSTDLADGKHYVIFTFPHASPITTLITGYTPSIPATITVAASHTVAQGDAYSIVNSQRVFFSNVSGQDFQSVDQGTAIEVAAVISRVIEGIALPLQSGQVQLLSKIKDSAESALQVLGGTANTVLNFPTVAAVGLNNDYTLNRFNGQIELNVPAIKGDQYTAGTTLSRGFLVTGFVQPYTLVNGQTITLVVDEGAPQVVTFTTGEFGNISSAGAAEVAAAINSQIMGATAVVTADDGVMIYTNTYDPAIGSIEITASTATALGFSLDTYVPSILPGTAYVVSGFGGPYDFVPGDTLVVVLNNDIVGSTYDIPMTLGGTILTQGTPTTQQFTANITSVGQNFINFFKNNTDLVNMKVGWVTGSNTGATSIVSTYNATNGLITLVTALANPIEPGDTFDLIPVTLDNVVTYLSNSATSTLNLQATVQAVDNGTEIQIATNTIGTAGYVQVTGGIANDLSSAITINGTGPIPATFAGIIPGTFTTVGLTAVTPGPGGNTINLTFNGTQATYVDTNDTPNITFTAVNYGPSGNSISLTFDGVSTIATIVAAWNSANPNNQVTYSGLATVIPMANTYNLAGGIGNTINAEIAIWNTANPSNQVTLSSGDGTQIPPATSNAQLSGGLLGGSVWTQDALFAPGMTVLLTGANPIPASFSGTLAGTIGPVVLTATLTGPIGNNINLVFNGTSSINTVIAQWNNANSPNTLVLTSGDGAQIPSAFANAQLSGGIIIPLTSLAATIASVTPNNPTSGSYLITFVGNPDVSRFTTVASSIITRTNILAFPTNILQGVDAYEYWTGLLQIVQWTVDGLQSNISAYPGLKAAGVQIEVEAPLVIQAVFEINPTYAQGVTENQVENDIINAVSTYVNSLSVGQTCILEQIRTNIMAINGIIDVEIISPLANIVPTSQQQLIRVTQSNIIIG